MENNEWLVENKNQLPFFNHWYVLGHRHHRFDCRSLAMRHARIHLDQSICQKMAKTCENDIISYMWLIYMTVHLDIESWKYFQEVHISLIKVDLVPQQPQRQLVHLASLLLVLVPWRTVLWQPRWCPLKEWNPNFQRPAKTWAERIYLFIFHLLKIIELNPKTCI